MRGGRKFGAGSYGSVYGEPRLPCSDETIDMVRDLKEVSKVFKDEDAAHTEYEVIETLTRTLNADDFARFSEIAMLPIRKCFMKPGVLEEEPYSSPIWREGRVPGSDAIVIYKQGVGDLSEYVSIFSRSVSIQTMYEVCTSFRDIIESIKIIQKYNMFHGDLKPQNIIYYNALGVEQLKLGDNGDIREIIPYDVDIETYSMNFMYFARPSISIYFEVWNRSVYRDYDKYGESSEDIFKLNKPYTTDSIKLLFTKHQRFNNSSIMHMIYTLRHGSNFAPNRGFPQEMHDLVKEMARDIMNQETFNAYKNIPSYFDTYDLLKPLEFEKALDDPIKMRSIQLSLDKYNPIFLRISPEDKDLTDSQLYDTSDDINRRLKLDLFKRTDIFSLGICVYDILLNYRIGLSDMKVTEVDDDMVRFIYHLNVFAYICCKQFNKCIGINILLALFDQILRLRGREDINFVIIIPELKGMITELYCDIGIGYRLRSDRKYDVMMKYFTRALDMGSCRAATLIGEYHYKITRNYDEMRKYFEMAIAQCKHIGAIRMMAKYYSTVERNIEEARRYYTMAIEQGDTDAINELRMLG